MSDIKHIGAMTIGIIGEGLIDRNEKIRAILETPSESNVTKLIDIKPLIDNLAVELEDRKDD